MKTALCTGSATAPMRTRKLSPSRVLQGVVKAQLSRCVQLTASRCDFVTPTLAAVAQVFEYLSGFRKYDWLWKEDKDVQYKRFVASNPAISDYEAELAKFMDIESEIEAIPTFHNIGPLTLNTTNLKLQLGSESRQWKIQYSNKVGALQCVAEIVPDNPLEGRKLPGVARRSGDPRLAESILRHTICTAGYFPVDVPVVFIGIVCWSTRAAGSSQHFVYVG